MKSLERRIGFIYVTTKERNAEPVHRRYKPDNLNEARDVQKLAKLTDNVWIRYWSHTVESFRDRWTTSVVRTLHGTMFVYARYSWLSFKTEKLCSFNQLITSIVSSALLRLRTCCSITGWQWYLPWSHLRWFRYCYTLDLPDDLQNMRTPKNLDRACSWRMSHPPWWHSTDSRVRFTVASFTSQPTVCDERIVDVVAQFVATQESTLFVRRRCKLGSDILQAPGWVEITLPDGCFQTLGLTEMTSSTTITDLVWLTKRSFHRWPSSFVLTLFVSGTYIDV
jgi:hypothetical protein